MTIFTGTLGFVGLGKMGWPMFRRLKDGVANSLFVEIDDVRATAAATLGASRVTGPGGLAPVDVLVSSLPDDRALVTALAGGNGLLSGLRRGAILVETSTVSPTASRAVAEAATARGVAYLRAPVSGTNVTAEQGQLSMLVSGPAEPLERLRPLLSRVAQAIRHVGDEEQARYLKLAINAMVANTATMFAEALALGRRGGIEWDVLLDAFAESAVASPLVRYKAPPLKSRDFTAAFDCRQMAKDMDLIMSAARENDVPMPATALTQQTYRALIARGLGAEDYIATVKLAEELSGLDPPSRTG